MSTLLLPINEQWYGCNPVGGPVSVGPSGPSPVGIVTDAAQAASGIASSIAGVEAGTLTAASAAGPIGLAVMGLVSLGFALANVFSGCGETCVAATQYANAAEEKLNALLEQWNTAPVHTASMQRVYLTIVVGVFQALCQACGQPSLGSAGQRCISERLIAGSTAPWCPTGTGCDWVTTYYLPVANATDIIPDSQGTVITPGTIQPNYNSQPQQGGMPTTPTGQAPMSDNSVFYIVGFVALLAFIKHKKS